MTFRRQLLRGQLAARVPAWLKTALRPLRDSVRNSIREFTHAPGTQALIRAAPRPFKLHLGCGDKVIPGWLNIDIYGREGIAVMRLPGGLSRFADNSVGFVYCSHMLEHINYPDEALLLWREIRRALILGGAVRFVVPGIEQIIRAYVADDSAFFKKQEAFHPAWCTTKMEHLLYALQQDGQHRYGYDFETAKKLLLRAGFTRVINSHYQCSEFPELRVDYRGESGLSLFVDAVA
jgi:predicted SAM-dependent methyltransferase